MKKILFAALVACFSMNASAQIAVEVMTDPFNGFTFEGAKVRYFLDESSAIRATVDFNTNSNTTNAALVVPNAEVPATLGGLPYADAKTIFDIQKDDFTKVSTTYFSFAVGYEKILASLGKASFYAGGDLFLSKTWNKTYSETADITGTTKNGVNKVTRARGGDLNLGLAGFCGIDYAVTDNLYLGIESKLAITYSVAPNTMVTTEPYNGTKTEVETEVKDNTLDVTLRMLPALRIGWKF